MRPKRKSGKDSSTSKPGIDEAKALEGSISPIIPNAHKMVNQRDPKEYLAENSSSFKM